MDNGKIEFSNNFAGAIVPSILPNSKGCIGKEFTKKQYQKRGNPYKRNKTWTFWYYEEKSDGKKIQRYKGGFKTRQDALEAMHQVKLEQSLHRYVSPNDLTVKTYLEGWLESSYCSNLARNTLSGYRHNVSAHIIPYIGNVKLNKLCRNNIQFVHEQLSDHLAPASIRYVHQTFSKALNDAKLDSLIFHLPTAGVAIPKVPRFMSRILTCEEIRHLADILSSEEAGFAILAAVTLGLRRGEILGLKYLDFDCPRNTVHIQRQVGADRQPAPLKTSGSNRVLHLPKALISKLQVTTDGNLDRYITAEPDGTPRSPGWLQSQWERIRNIAGIGNVRLHDLRHTFASQNLDNGVDLKVISALLGHSSIGITADIYCDVLSHQRDVVASTMDQILRQ